MRQKVHFSDESTPLFQWSQWSVTVFCNGGQLTALIALFFVMGIGQAIAAGCQFDRVLLTTQFSILEDPSRTLTIEQVNQAPYKDRFRLNSTGRNNFGLSRSAYWIRIRPVMPPECYNSWILGFSWPLLDSIEFYRYRNNRWQKLATGANYPYASRQIDFQNFMFRLPDLSNGSVFFRVSGNNPLFMDMRLLQEERFIHRAHYRLLMQGVILGVLLGLILYNLFVFLSLRHTAYLYYALYLASTTLLVAQYDGLATRYLWPDSPAWNIRTLWVFGLTGIAAYLAFLRNFLAIGNASPSINPIFQGYIAVSLLAVIALAFADTGITVWFLPLLIIIALTVSGFATVKGISCGKRPERFVYLANILFGMGILWVVALTAGYPEKVLMMNHFIFEAGLTLEALLLSLALAARIKCLQQEKLAAQLNLLQTKQHFSTQLIASQDAEQKRIAGELHDGIGQNLIVIKSRLTRLLKISLDSQLTPHLDFASDITQKTIHELRGISHRLHPHELDRLGLVVAIETLVSESLVYSGIRVSYRIADIDELLGRDQALHLYRILQEAIRNIITHARADQVSVSITRTDNQKIELRIADNGRGIHTPWFELNDFSQGFGLSSICERVRLLEGTVIIHNRQPKGLALSISIPITLKTSIVHEKHELYERIQ